MFANKIFCLITGMIIQKEWYKIRRNFVRCLNQNKIYYLHDALIFLIPFVQSRTKVSVKKDQPKLSLVEKPDDRFSSYMSVENEYSDYNDNEVIFVDKTPSVDNSEGNGIVNPDATKNQQEKAEEKNCYKKCLDCWSQVIRKVFSNLQENQKLEAMIYLCSTLTNLKKNSSN